MADNNGLVLVYTGDGKGKTTAAMGLVLRAVGHDQKAMVIQFLKGRQSGELTALQRWLPQVDVQRFGRDVFVNPDSPADEDVALAAEAMQLAEQATSSGQYDLVVLDELNVANDYGLVREADVLAMLRNRHPQVTVVLTGRGASAAIRDAADMVSEVKEIKHHWRQGIVAQPGIEF